MAKYTLNELQAAAANATGGKLAPRHPKVLTAIAVSLAENPGMDSMTNSPPNSDGSIDRGPWQLNSRWHREVSDQCAHDLNCAAKETYRISSGYTNFKPWTTFKNKAYEDKLDQADQDTGKKPFGGDPILGGAASVVTDTAGAIAALASAVEKFVEGLFSSATWFRIGKVIVGLFFGAVAIIILVRKAGVV